MQGEETADVENERRRIYSAVLKKMPRIPREETIKESSPRAHDHCERDRRQEAVRSQLTKKVYMAHFICSGEGVGGKQPPYEKSTRANLPTPSRLEEIVKRHRTSAERARFLYSLEKAEDASALAPLGHFRYGF